MNADLIFLPFAVVIGLWVAFSDVKTMLIPNKAVIALLAVFAVIGPFALPLDVYGWRWAHFAVVLVIGFVLASVGPLGAGDAKFAAAMAPFIANEDIGGFLMMFSLVLIAAFIVHRVAKRIPAVRRATPDWQSWERRDFPMGLALGTGLPIYLALSAFAAS